ncbi:hypothetical protein MTYM_01689 [Methylococcales bacterium]|nr:hypothetical protein MTYM_01689 [Methylococcales bacterium]
MRNKSPRRPSRPIVCWLSISQADKKFSFCATGVLGSSMCRATSEYIGEALLFPFSRSINAIDRPPESAAGVAGEPRPLACLPPIASALRERVVTIESAVLLGFAIIKQKLLGSPKPDAMLRLVMKPDMREPDLSECLRSYSREVQPLLAFRELVLGE